MSITNDEFKQWEKDWQKRIDLVTTQLQKDALQSILNEARFNFSIGRKMDFKIINIGVENEL
jgi:hypothetical protein